MNKQTAILTLVVSVFLLVSFSTDPPNGKTGAPGESLCVECHTPQSSTLEGSISIEGFPEIIIPGDTFTLTIVNRNTVGDAVRGGFQMTILGPFNTRVGVLQKPSASSAIQIANNRQYFEHKVAPMYPDSNVLKWTVEWVASNLPASGQVTAYIAGNICNGNFQSSGDKTVTSSVKGTVLLSANEEIVSLKPLIYPNPGTNQIRVALGEDENLNGSIYFYNNTGAEAGRTQMNLGKIDVPPMPSGMYWMKVQTAKESYIEKWIKI